MSQKSPPPPCYIILYIWSYDQMSQKTPCSLVAARAFLFALTQWSGGGILEREGGGWINDDKWVSYDNMVINATREPNQNWKRPPRYLEFSRNSNELSHDVNIGVLSWGPGGERALHYGLGFAMYKRVAFILNVEAVDSLFRTGMLLSRVRRLDGEATT